MNECIFNNKCLDLEKDYKQEISQVTDIVKSLLEDNIFFSLYLLVKAINKG